MASATTTGRDDDQETNDAFREALKAFKRKCSARNLERFEVMSSVDVKCEIIRIQRDQERLKAMLNIRRMQKFILRMEELQVIVNGFLDGGHFLSYVWGTTHFLLSNAATVLTDGLDSLLDAYERLGKQIPALRGLEALFTRHTGMRKCLSALYTDILEFHSGAYQCFTQFTDRGRKKIFKSAWKDFNNRIHLLEDNIQAHRSLVEAGARLLHQLNSEEQDHTLTSQQAWMISTEVMEYENTSTTRSRAAKKEEEDRCADQFREALRWISGGRNTSEDTHADRCNVRNHYPETCDWIRKVDAVDNWMNVGTPTHSILWINGSMGAGKSTLTSYLVDQCKDSTSLGAPFKTIYFYCKGKDPESSTHLAIFRGLIHQQMLYIREDERFRHLIAYCYDKKDSSGQQHLTTGDAKPLLDLFFDIVPHQYIIIDGLDECEKPEIRQSLSLLTSVIARQDNTDPGRLRLLIVSRDIPEIKKPLSGEGTIAKIFKIEAEHNQEAISKYVTQRLKEFPRALNLDENEIEKIRYLTCDKARGARGMFLFAELVLNNLQQSIQKTTLLRELDARRFPQTLGQAYDRIIESIRKNQDDGEKWEKTKAIFGWLICAGRTLHWYEIQAIVSIERNNESVEFQKNKFIPDIQELCGTLVTVRPGNKVELIHHTAHEYILKHHFVNKVEVQFELATLCMQYLTFPCFEKGISQRDRSSWAKDGFYAFQDYAVSRWFHHIAEVVRISGQLLSIDATKSEKFAKILDAFTHRYQDSIEDLDSSQDDEASSSGISHANIKDIEELARKECGILKDAAFYPILLKLWIHISKHEKKPIEERNKPSLKEMEKAIVENRKVVEALFESAKGEEIDRVVEYYGSNIYKCPRTRCDFFHEGFGEEKKREHHINRHDRPFECTIQGCNIAAAGFISNKDLDRHKKNYHMNSVDVPAGFPQLNKKKNNEARFDCKICGQKFTRKINLTGHTRSHFGERPYGCQNCGKKFTRVNDLRRHEKLHLRK